MNYSSAVFPKISAQLPVGGKPDGAGQYWDAADRARIPGELCRFAEYAAKTLLTSRVHILVYVTFAANF